MKKKLIYAAVVSALLSGCGGSDDNKGDTSSYLDYLLSGTNAARPSALAARASDGTLKFSTETADLSNPVSALSTLDGWSTTQAIQIVPVTASGITVRRRPPANSVLPWPRSTCWSWNSTAPPCARVA